jgi:hypothetical protein
MLPLLAFALSMFVAIDMQQRKFQQQEEQRQYQQRQYQRQDIIPDRIMWTAVSAAAGGFVGLIYLHSK